MWTKNHNPEGEFLVQTPFSRSTLKLDWKNSRREITRFFANPKSLIHFDLKNHEDVWTYLKKHSRQFAGK